MSEKNDKAFWDFMAVIRSSFEESGRAGLAFWLAVWHGEDARDRAVLAGDPDPAPEQFAFELGLQLRPVWGEIAPAIKAALVQLAVQAVLGSVGAGKK